ncbi:MAG: OmpA family protein [Psychrobacter sp.]|nr:OmpA family protein [Psychrobacter sp.]
MVNVMNRLAPGPNQQYLSPPSTLIAKGLVNAGARLKSLESLPLAAVSLAFITAVMGLPATAYAASNHDIMPVKYSPIITDSSGARTQNYCSPEIEAITRHPKKPTQLQYNIDCMMSELKAYQSVEAEGLVPYYAYKAQAWLNYAYHENSEGSMTAAGSNALAEGLTILQALRDKKIDSLLLTSDIPATSAMMRPDLWATLMGLKAHGAVTIAPREMAFSEVKLIWAAAEYCEFGWRHAREHFSAAERWINQSHEAFVGAKSDTEALALEADTVSMFKLYEPLDAKDNQCRGQAIPSMAAPITLDLPTAQVSYEVTPEESKVISLPPYFVHFALDEANLSSESQTILNKLQNDLSQLPDNLKLSNIKFDLFGYTDSRASQSYNLALSKRRTQAVADYLISQGVLAQQIMQHPEGKQSLLSEGEDKIDHALNRRVEIVLSAADMPQDIIIDNSPISKNDAINNRRYSKDLQLEK